MYLFPDRNAPVSGRAASPEELENVPDPANTSGVKIRVHDSDGVFRGGLFKTRSYNAISCRTWPGWPHPDYAESLIDIAGKNNPCYDSSWVRLQIATVPDISGPPDGSDDFDANSRALRITPAEAHQWLVKHDYTPPADLLALLNISAPTVPSMARANTASAPVLVPMPEGVRAVWDALEGKAMTAKDLANRLNSSEDAMRKRVDHLRALGYDVHNQRGAGYYRPDALPPRLAISHSSEPESD